MHGLNQKIAGKEKVEHGQVHAISFSTEFGREDDNAFANGLQFFAHTSRQSKVTAEGHMVQFGTIAYRAGQGGKSRMKD